MGGKENIRINRGKWVGNVMITILLLSLGFIFLGFGIYRLVGPVSVWYLANGVYTVIVNYLAVPAGITFTIWAVATLPFISVNQQLNLFIIGAFISFVGVYPATYFLKPSWLRWLQREHSDMMPLLQTEIERIGPRNWDERINTRLDLEKWVADVQQKRRL